MADIAAELEWAADPAAALFDLGSGGARPLSFTPSGANVLCPVLMVGEAVASCPDLIDGQLDSFATAYGAVAGCVEAKLRALLDEQPAIPSSAYMNVQCPNEGKPSGSIILNLSDSPASPEVFRRLAPHNSLPAVYGSFSLPVRVSWAVRFASAPSHKLTLRNLPGYLAYSGLGASILRAGGVAPEVKVVGEMCASRSGMPTSPSGFVRCDVVLVFLSVPASEAASFGLPPTFVVGDQTVSVSVGVCNTVRATARPPAPSVASDAGARDASDRQRQTSTGTASAQPSTATAARATCEPPACGSGRVGPGGPLSSNAAASCSPPPAAEAMDWQAPQQLGMPQREQRPTTEGGVRATAGPARSQCGDAAHAAPATSAMEDAPPRYHRTAPGSFAYTPPHMRIGRGAGAPVRNASPNDNLIPASHAPSSPPQSQDEDCTVPQQQRLGIPALRQAAARVTAAPPVAAAGNGATVDHAPPASTWGIQTTATACGMSGASPQQQHLAAGSPGFSPAHMTGLMMNAPHCPPPRFLNAVPSAALPPPMPQSQAMAWCVQQQQWLGMPGQAQPTPHGTAVLAAAAEAGSAATCDAPLTSTWGMQSTATARGMDGVMTQQQQMPAGSSGATLPHMTGMGERSPLCPPPAFMNPASSACPLPLTSQPQVMTSSMLQQCPRELPHIDRPAANAKGDGTTDGGRASPFLPLPPRATGSGGARPTACAAVTGSEAAAASASTTPPGLLPSPPPPGLRTAPRANAAASSAPSPRPPASLPEGAAGQHSQTARWWRQLPPRGQGPPPPSPLPPSAKDGRSKRQKRRQQAGSGPASIAGSDPTSDSEYGAVAGPGTADMMGAFSSFVKRLNNVRVDWGAAVAQRQARPPAHAHDWDSSTEALLVRLVAAQHSELQFFSSHRYEAAELAQLFSAAYDGLWDFAPLGNASREGDIPSDLQREIFNCANAFISAVLVTRPELHAYVRPNAPPRNPASAGRRHTRSAARGGQQAGP